MINEFDNSSKILIATVDPDISNVVDKLNTEETLENSTFSLYNKHDSVFLLFLPNADDEGQRTEMTGFAFKRIPDLKIAAWSKYRNWKFTSGCRSALNEVFMATGTQLFILGSDHNELSRDWIGDQECFTRFR